MNRFRPGALRQKKEHRHWRRKRLTLFRRRNLRLLLRIRLRRLRLPQRELSRRQRLLLSPPLRPWWRKQSWFLQGPAPLWLLQQRRRLRLFRGQHLCPSQLQANPKPTKGRQKRAQHLKLNPSPKPTPSSEESPKAKPKATPKKPVTEAKKGSEEKKKDNSEEEKEAVKPKSKEKNEKEKNVPPKAAASPSDKEKKEVSRETPKSVPQTKPGGNGENKTDKLTAGPEGKPGSASGKEGEGAGGNNGDMAGYGKILQNRFYAAWNQPMSEMTLGKKLEVTVKLHVEGDGTVTEFSIVEGSGNAVVDESVRQAGANLGKLPPPPNHQAFSAPVRFELGN